MPAMTRPAIEKVSVAGFRSIKQVEDCDLGPINILVGANGSGKSNFVGVFSFLRHIIAGNLQSYVGRAGGADEILHFGSKTTAELAIHISFRDALGSYANGYKIVLSPASADTLRVQSEQVFFHNRREYPEPWDDFLPDSGKEAAISNRQVTDQHGVADRVRDNLMSWEFYHFHDTSTSSPIKKTAKLDDNNRLRPDGSNLAAFLYLLHEKYQSSYHFICGTIRLAAPFFKDFVLTPRTLNKDTILLGWQHVGTDAYFNADSLSDGSLRFIALTTLLLQPEEFLPSVILLDEPELGLHPAAITLLASLIRQASTKTQIILATQSPLLLDHFLPEDVLVADRVNGSTHFTKCAKDKKRLTAWLEDYSLGQLWEKNEIGGRPAPETAESGPQR